jgi:hypothetical protein
LIAKKAEAARKKGGSPMALEEWTATGLVASFRSVTRKSRGTSLKAGILYAPGPRVKRLPGCGWGCVVWCGVVCVDWVVG